MRQGKREGGRGKAQGRQAARLLLLRQMCVRGAGVECDRCVRACPAGAVSIGEDGYPRVDADTCTRCGICLGVCDAFSSSGPTLRSLHDRARRIATRGERVVLTCKRNVFPGLVPADNVVVLPCLAVVPPELWTLLLAERVRVSVYCDLAYCEDCPTAAPVGGAMFPRAIQMAEERAGSKVRTASEIPEKGGSHADDPLGRREAFDGLVGDLAKVATGKRRIQNSEVLQEYYEKRERRQAVGDLNLASDDDLDGIEGKRRTLFPRQRMVLETVVREPEAAPRIPVSVTRVDRGCPGSQGCDGVCAQVCPTGAMTTTKGTPQVAAELCVGCGACEQACPHDACHVEDATAEEYLPRLRGGAKK